ncbi:MAG: zinc-ribbon domain-containing protein, partial [Ruminococcus sp.]|nr:zinc-ribbon domain-containing protein [Ruminococcus sp.]
HGFYSVRVVDPFKFYEQVIPSSAKTGNESVSFSEIARQYTGEFTSALGATINKYSADGNRISYIKSKQYELGEIMSTFLDEKWTQLRGLEVVSVNVDASYDQDSQELINMRNKGAMLSDQAIQQGYVAGNISEGLKDAGSNANGSMAGFMGMGIGMNAGGNILGGYMQNPQYNNQQPNQQMNQQMNPQQQAQPQQQTAPVQGGWTCECGATNTGNFCSECGSKKPDAPKKKFCTNCGTELSVDAKFCPECGTKA